MKTGLGNKYYELPEGAEELQDLIEYKDMNFALGNIFKAVYRLGQKPDNDRHYDLEKIIWFANRELKRINDDDLLDQLLEDPHFKDEENEGSLFGWDTSDLDPPYIATSGRAYRESKL